VDGNAAVLPARALLLLRASAATLQCRVVKVGAVQLIDADVLQLLALGTDIAVFLGYIGELLDPVQIALRHRTLFHPGLVSA